MLNALRASLNELERVKPENRSQFEMRYKSFGPFVPAYLLHEHEILSI